MLYNGRVMHFDREYKPAIFLSDVPSFADYLECVGAPVVRRDEASLIYILISREEELVISTLAVDASDPRDAINKECYSLLIGKYVMEDE